MNVSIFRFFNNLGITFPWLDPIAVFVAEYMAYLLLIALVIFWFTRKRDNRLMVISAFVAEVLAYGLARFAGLFHQNFQPFAELDHVNKLIEHSIDNSFPSDHTAFFFSICMIFWLFKKSYRYWWLILAAFVGTSRMLVGVHYPLDVLVGALAGVLAALFVFYTVPRWKITHYLLDLYEKVEAYIWPKKAAEK